MPDKPLMNVSHIQKLLPHRSPFLFVDRVLELEAGKRILAEKDLLPDEPFFSGHFPGRPIMPGVLVSEALAQASGLLAGLSLNDKNASKEKKAKTIFYLSSVNIKFYTPASPGCTLRMESFLKKQYGKLYLFEVRASAAGNTIAEGTLTLSGATNDI